MSYQPEPDVEKEFPKIFAFKKRILTYGKVHPVRFWLCLWLFFAVPCILIFLAQGLDGFNTPRDKAALLISILGWVYPFVLFIRKNRS